MKWSLEELVPQRPPMLLIDEVENFDPEAKMLTAKVTITPGQIFYFGETEGVPNWVAIEYMAQASAALAGCYDKQESPEGPARAGFLLGTRKLELKLAHFEAGKIYHITSVNAFWDEGAAAFECTIRDEAGAIVAKATLNAYRPPNLENFLKEMKES